MPSHRGHQKKVEKKKKKRLAVQRAVRAEAAPLGKNATLRLAAESPFGPAFMTPSWRDDSVPPRLVNVVLTRQLPDGTFFVMSHMVDRAFFGVKSAFAGSMSPGELDDLLEQTGDAYQEDLEKVSVLEAQSVIFHAVDFARSLGLEPDGDFASDLVGPRPDVLLDTPLARPNQPHYVEGPYDDPVRVARALAMHAAAPSRLDASSE